MSFWKPGQQQPLVVAKSAEKKSSSALVLSASVKSMKFMQRNDAIDAADTTSQLKNPTSSVLVESSFASKQWERVVVSTLFPGRRSFGGCNKFVERQYDKTLEELFNIKKPSRAISQQQESDEVILKEYETLISLPRGPNQGKKPSISKQKYTEKEIGKRKASPDYQNGKRTRARE